MLKTALLPNANTKSSSIIAYSPAIQAKRFHVPPFLIYAGRKGHCE